MHSPFWCTSAGAVVEDTGTCNCAYPDCGGYAMHEPYCGIEPIGYLPVFDDEPSLLPTMLWDFGALG